MTYSQNFFPMISMFVQKKKITHMFCTVTKTNKKRDTFSLFKIKLQQTGRFFLQAQMPQAKKTKTT